MCDNAIIAFSYEQIICCLEGAKIRIQYETSFACNHLFKYIVQFIWCPNFMFLSKLTCDKFNGNMIPLRWLFSSIFRKKYTSYNMTKKIVKTVQWSSNRVLFTFWKYNSACLNFLYLDVCLSTLSSGKWDFQSHCIDHLSWKFWNVNLCLFCSSNHLICHTIGVCKASTSFLNNTLRKQTNKKKKN